MACVVRAADSKLKEEDVINFMANKVCNSFPSLVRTIFIICG